MRIIYQDMYQDMHQVKVSVICQDIDQVNFHQYNVMYFIRTCIRSISGQSEFFRTGQDIRICIRSR